MGRAVVSLGYAEKNRALLADMGLEGYSQALEDLDISRLQNQISKLLAEREQHEQRIAARIQEYRVRLKRQGNYLFQHGSVCIG
jgi:polysaccharide pyruvyl transferase WcaK-like protein